MGEAMAWLARWSEDEGRVRRTLTVRRCEDGAEVTLVATLCSFGYGVDTALAHRRAAVDELREGRLEAVRRRVVLDADAHLVAVVDAVVDVHPVRRRSDDAAQDDRVRAVRQASLRAYGPTRGGFTGSTAGSSGGSSSSIVGSSGSSLSGKRPPWRRARSSARPFGLSSLVGMTLFGYGWPVVGFTICTGLE